MKIPNLAIFVGSDSLNNVTEAGPPIPNLAIFVGSDSLNNVTEAGPPIIAPIRVGGPELRIAAPRVHDIAVEHAPRAQVVMQVPTESGHRYRVEQSTSMLGGWDMSSSVQDVITGPDGLFVGTGGMVTCLVPCGADEELMFFRIRDLTLD